MWRAPKLLCVQQEPVRLERLIKLRASSIEDPMTIGSYDVVSEHDHIHHLVDRLESWVERREQMGTAWLPGLCTRIEQLNADLGPHFHGEESVVFQDIRSRIPRLAGAVERLIEQHRRMERHFSRISADAKQIDVSNAESVNSVTEQLSKSLRLLSVHEQQEMELILSAYGQDLGEP